MTTSTFIRFGEKAEHIFNIAQINAIWKETQTLTEHELSLPAYKEFPLHGEKRNIAYGICIRTIDPKPMCYIYLTEAVRDASFEKIAAVLEPLVINKAELVDVSDPVASVPTAKRTTKSSKKTTADGAEGKA